MVLVVLVTAAAAIAFAYQPPEMQILNMHPVCTAQYSYQCAGLIGGG